MLALLRTNTPHSTPIAPENQPQAKAPSPFALMDRWMNRWVKQHAPQSPQQGEARYEAESLYFCCDGLHEAGSEDRILWNDETFLYLQKQFPMATHWIFYGQQDPLGSIPRLLPSLGKLHQQFPELQFTLYTSGQWLDRFGSALLQSPIRTVVLQLGGHTPSLMQQHTGLPATQFLKQYSQLYDFITKKRQYQCDSITVLAAFALTQQHYSAGSEMLRWSEQLGVDGVLFYNTELPFLKHRHFQEEQREQVQLHGGLQGYQQWVEQMNPAQFRLPFRLPALLANPNSRTQPLQQCRFPFEALTLSQSMQVQACPRTELAEVPSSQVWEGDVWNNQHFQWARRVHGHYHQQQLGMPPASVMPLLPKACRHCEFNQPRPTAWKNPHLLPAEANAAMLASL